MTASVDMRPARAARPPVVWSIAGHDSSGGAGLSADQRAADAMGVHLCPIVACITAQSSVGVQAVFPVSSAQLDAQLTALAADMPPSAIKVGLLGHVDLVHVVAKWVRRLRQAQPHLPLVVDPVLGATAGGAAFSDDAVCQALREALLPLATLATPNRAEASRLLGLAARHDGPADDVPALAMQLHAMGMQGVVITGGDAPPQSRKPHGEIAARHCTWAVDWLDVPQAQGWLCTPRIATPHHHGSGCIFAMAAASAMALGHGSADAVVLAKMLATQALRQARVAGQGAGPVVASTAQPLGTLPYLGLGRALPWQVTHGDGSGAPLFQRFVPPEDGLYGILPDSTLLNAAADAGLRCLQLRHKPAQGARQHIEASLAACARHSVTLFVNDHWQDALTLGAVGQVTSTGSGAHIGLHLGQEDLLALDQNACQELLAARGRIVLGLSSHSAWELARAAGCGASLIACGPVQPTTTKDMPWRPQSDDNLRWWVAHSPAPVVAIGGLLTAADLQRFAACGPVALCVVRALGDDAADMARKLPALRKAIAEGRQRVCERQHGVTLPHPVL